MATVGPRSNAASAARILRFHFDQKLRQFVLDPNFPVQLTQRGSNAIVIARDSTATDWVAYVSDGQLMVAHTLGDDVRWTAPYPLPGVGQLRPEDVASIVAFGPGKVGVMWTDQAAGRVLFQAHDEGAADDAWSAREVAIDGQGSADGHLDVKTFMQGGRQLVAAAVKTSLDSVADPNPLAAQILVLIRRENGRWDAVEAGRVQDKHSRPIILVDEERRFLYVAAQSPVKGGVIYLKRAPLDDPVFQTGSGDPFIATETDPTLADATSTKQPVSQESGLVVLASDAGTGRYVHAAVDLGGTPLSGQVAALARPDTPEVPDIGRTDLVHDDFDPWPIGATADNGWVDVVTGGTVAVAEADGERALRLASKSAADSASSCKDLPGGSNAPLEMDLRFRLTANGSGDARLATVRIPGGEIVGLRAGADGAFSYFDGQRRVRTDLSLADGRWYRARLGIDIAKRQTSIRIFGTGDSPLLTRTGVGWRTDQDGQPNRVCFRVSGGAATLDVDSIIVSR